MSHGADPRETGALAEHRNASRAERIAAGWQPRFVVDQSRMVEMVRLYQALGYETAVDPILPEDAPPEHVPPEHVPDDRAGEVPADEPGRMDPRCGDCRLVSLRWLHVIYTRPAPSRRGA